jgi:hypothetical protein
MMGIFRGKQMEAGGIKYGRDSESLPDEAAGLSLSVEGVEPVIDPDGPPDGWEGEDGEEIDLRALADLEHWLRSWHVRPGVERGMRRRIERFHRWAAELTALRERLRQNTESHQRTLDRMHTAEKERDVLREALERIMRSAEAGGPGEMPARWFADAAREALAAASEQKP